MPLPGIRLGLWVSQDSGGDCSGCGDVGQGQVLAGGGTRRWAVKWSSLICEPPQVGQTIHVLLPENLRPSPSPHVCHLCSLCFCGIMYVRTLSIPVAVSPAVQVSGTACSSSACVLQSMLGAAV